MKAQAAHLQALTKPMIDPGLQGILKPKEKSHREKYVTFTSVGEKYHGSTRQPREESD